MCCGNQRQQFHAGNPAGHGVRLASSKASAGTRRQAAVYFEYVGPTGLTAVGGASGARYRFERGGAVVTVDPRDRRSLQAIPSLRQVTSPW